MLTNQAGRNPLSNVMAAPVVAERVFRDVEVQVLRGNPMVEAENADLEKSEEAPCGVDVDAHAAFGSRILTSRVRYPQVTTHLAAEPVIGGEFIGAEDEVAV